ncbi:hypothetical protein MRX96_047441 [Rhipicephalus microplus]
MGKRRLLYSPGKPLLRGKSVRCSLEFVVPKQHLAPAACRPNDEERLQKVTKDIERDKGPSCFLLFGVDVLQFDMDITALPCAYISVLQGSPSSSAAI